VSSVCGWGKSTCENPILADLAVLTTSHGHLVTRSCRHTVNSSPVNLSHTRLVTQSTRRKRAHNKATSRNFFSAAHRSCSTQKQCSTWTAYLRQASIQQNIRNANAGQFGLIIWV